MLDHIAAVLRASCGLVPEQTVIVGVSGGPDSLCLMEILRQAGYALVVAHFNHRLRPEADSEATQVEQTAARLMLSSVVGSGDVRKYAAEHGMSLEEAARHLRYTFLFEQAQKWNAQAVAVGHTADDQVETVLMHFLRGAGLTGLKGMSMRTLLPAFDTRIPIVRPLLDTWREETVVYCAANSLRPHYDPSNDSLNFTRNRVRNLLIPTLETYNPRFREAVWRSTQSLKADHALLRETMDLAWKECVIQETSEVIVFDAARLKARAAGFQRNLVRRAVEALRPNQEVTFAMLERAARLVHSTAARVDLAAGLSLFREGDRFYLSTPAADLGFDKWPQMPVDSAPIPVALPGEVELSGGWRFSGELWRLTTLAYEQAEHNEDNFQVWLDAEQIRGPLELRARRAGDRFQPLGMEGHSQKVSDFLTNAKMPHRLRDRWPLLCAGNTVLWIPGYRPAHACRLTPSTREVAYFAVACPPGKESL
ncbi:MAG: tRNA lysidine(34) synthetase TilS [Chloroflexota bacterium]